MRIWSYLVFLGFLTCFSSCSDTGPGAVIPFAFVNEDINLDEIQNQALRQPGGFIYVEGGFRGIILYHDGFGNYSAFERACTYDPLAECDPIAVDSSGLFMMHQCCQSAFLFDGNPNSGPAPYPLKRYPIYREGNFLLIRNQ